MLRSVFIWTTSALLMLIWLPLMAIRRLFDRDPVHFESGRLFRKLGRAMTMANPSWTLHILGEDVTDPRRPYVFVSNHQSLADIPLISNLPWEMKWMGKKELFDVPIMGWMMKLSDDIQVDRKNARSGALALIRAQHFLEKKCSVLMFPEGTRTPDGRVHAFNDGAFHLAIRAKVPVRPIVIEGSFGCIPKNTWKFGKPSDVKIKVLPMIDTTGLTTNDVQSLRDRVRLIMVATVAELRGVPVKEVNGTVN
jgi:1-acyl-sn-glycerol-3-phosphate acyltransferase